MSRGRKSRNEYLLEQVDFIKFQLNKTNKKIFSTVDLGKITKLLDDSEDFIMPYSFHRKNFIDFLCDNEILTEYQLKKGSRTTKKYVFGVFNIYDLALSLSKSAYLSHYTAMFIHELTDNIPKVIYTNSELWGKSIKSNKKIEQVNIHKAFSRPMRKTNNIYNFKDVEIVVLNSKNTGRLGIINTDVLGEMLPVTSIERTLIDIVVRPLYAGGIAEVLEAYKKAKGKFSTGRLIATLNKLDYAYPYHQAIGFYMEKAGYSESVLKRFERMPQDNDFYLSYQIKDPSYSEKWRIYHPSYLD